MEVNIKLPKCVYFKHGSYYLVKKNVWHRLCKNRDDVESTMTKVLKLLPADYKTEVLIFTKKLITRSKQNAKNRGKNFSLVVGDAETLLGACDWKCAVTKRRFTFERINNKMPYAPSIDRINSNKGYHFNNCRVVCVATNYGMNVWGEEVFKNIKRSVKSK